MLTFLNTCNWTKPRSPGLSRLLLVVASQPQNHPLSQRRSHDHHQQSVRAANYHRDHRQQYQQTSQTIAINDWQEHHIFYNNQHDDYDDHVDDDSRPPKYLKSAPADSVELRISPNSSMLPAVVPIDMHSYLLGCLKSVVDRTFEKNKQITWNATCLMSPWNTAILFSFTSIL